MWRTHDYHLIVANWIESASTEHSRNQREHRHGETSMVRGAIYTSSLEYWSVLSPRWKENEICPFLVLHIVLHYLHILP
jgi:hypothetical protein